MVDNRSAQSIHFCMYVCMYVCMYICHTLISVGSLVACAYIHDVNVIVLTQVQALREWT